MHGDTFEALRNGVASGRFAGRQRQEPAHYEAPTLDPEHVVPILTSLEPLTGGVGGVPLAAHGTVDRVGPTYIQ